MYACAFTTPLLLGVWRLPVYQPFEGLAGLAIYLAIVKRRDRIFEVGIYTPQVSTLNNRA
jgi:hypothetical protein